MPVGVEAHCSRPGSVAEQDAERARLVLPGEALHPRRDKPLARPLPAATFVTEVQRRRGDRSRQRTIRISHRRRKLRSLPDKLDGRLWRRLSPRKQATATPPPSEPRRARAARVGTRLARATAPDAPRRRAPLGDGRRRLVLAGVDLRPGSSGPPFSKLRPPLNALSVIWCATLSRSADRCQGGPDGCDT